MQTGTPCGRDNVEQILPQDLEAEERQRCRLCPQHIKIVEPLFGLRHRYFCKKKKKECVHHVDARRHFYVSLPVCPIALS